MSKPAVRTNIIRFLNEEWAATAKRLVRDGNCDSSDSDCYSIRCQNCPIGIGAHIRCQSIEMAVQDPDVLMAHMEHVERLIDLERRGIEVRRGRIICPSNH